MSNEIDELDDDFDDEVSTSEEESESSVRDKAVTARHKLELLKEQRALEKLLGDDYDF